MNRKYFVAQCVLLFHNSPTVLENISPFYKEKMSKRQLNGTTALLLLLSGILFFICKEDCCCEFFVYFHTLIRLHCRIIMLFRDYFISWINMHTAEADFRAVCWLRRLSTYVKVCRRELANISSLLTKYSLQDTSHFMANKKHWHGKSKYRIKAKQVIS